MSTNSSFQIGNLQGQVTALSDQIRSVDITSEFTLGPTITLASNRTEYFCVLKTGNTITVHFRGSTNSTSADPVIFAVPTKYIPKHVEALSFTVASTWNTSSLAIVNYYNGAQAFVFASTAYTKDVNYSCSFSWVV